MQYVTEVDPKSTPLVRSDPKLRGTRTKYVITHNPSYAHPGEEIYINLNVLGSSNPVDPNSIALRFTMSRTDQGSLVFNNLGSNLVQRLIVAIGGETIYDNSWENLLKTYSDLWLSQRDRTALTEFGICDELVRNPNDKTNKSAKKLADIFYKQKISIGKVIADQGMLFPSCMRENLSFTLVLADPKHILDKGTYMLNNLEIEYDVVDSSGLRELARAKYIEGKLLPFKSTSWLKQSNWSKDDTLINEVITSTKKSLNQIVMLFTKKNQRKNSEEFVFPCISKVNITVKGIPGSVYHGGMRTVDLLTEARKTFAPGQMKPVDFFCGDMFALCVDLRSCFNNNEYANGRNMYGDQSSVVLEIQRSESLGELEDLKCYSYVNYDCILKLNCDGMMSVIV